VQYKILSVQLLRGFSCSIEQVEEVYNFSQDDLLTEDILILDTHAEVFVWVGQYVDPKEKQNVFDIGQVVLNLFHFCQIFPVNVIYSIFSLQKYIEMAVSLDGLSPNVPLYKVTEGNEPSFFTTYFSWDLTKATVCTASALCIFSQVILIYCLTIEKLLLGIRKFRMS